MSIVSDEIFQNAHKNRGDLIEKIFNISIIVSATNIKHGESTKLKVALLINDKVILLVYRLIQGLIEFVKPKKYIWITWLIMWLLNLNLVSIIVAFLSFCFSFSAKRK